MQDCRLAYGVLVISAIQISSTKNDFKTLNRSMMLEAQQSDGHCNADNSFIHREMRCSSWIAPLSRVPFKLETVDAVCR